MQPQEVPVATCGLPYSHPAVNPSLTIHAAAATVSRLPVPPPALTPAPGVVLEPLVAWSTHTAWCSKGPCNQGAEGGGQGGAPGAGRMGEGAMAHTVEWTEVGWGGGEVMASTGNADAACHACSPEVIQTWNTLFTAHEGIKISMLFTTGIVHSSSLH